MVLEQAVDFLKVKDERWVHKKSATSRSLWQRTLCTVEKEDVIIYKKC